MYIIKPYTKRKAKLLNVYVRPSTRKGKKIDVYSKKWEYLTSIGAKGYADYPTFLQYYGKKYADQKRRLYKIRHQANRKVKGSRGWFADQLLW